MKNNISARTNGAHDLKRASEILTIGMMLILFSSPVIAGNESGNGGSGILLKNGEVILADPYIIDATGCDTCGTLGQDLSAGLKDAGRVLVRFGATADSDYGAAFIRDSVFSPFVEYRFVDELPAHCAQEQNEDEYVVPDEQGTWVPLACTKGWVTSIRKSFFSKMKLREQVKLIVHERLHHHAPQAAHVHIADLTQALDLFFKINDREQNGEKPMLSDQDVNRLQRLPLRITQLALTSDSAATLKRLTDYSVHAYGGGLIPKNKNVHADSGAFVSLMTTFEMVDPETSITLRTGSTSLNSHFQRSGGGELIVEEGASIANSVLSISLGKMQTEKFVIEKGVSIEDSQLRLSIDIGRIKEGAKLQNVTLSGGVAEITVGKNTVLRNLAGFSSFSSFTPMTQQLYFADDVTIDGISADSDFWRQSRHYVFCLLPPRTEIRTLEDILTRKKRRVCEKRYYE